MLIFHTFCSILHIAFADLEDYNLISISEALVYAYPRRSYIKIKGDSLMGSNVEKVRDKYATSRLLYIFEAAVEYFISILVGTTYLAKLTTSVGISDGVTGVLTAFVSLGSGFQIFALLIAHKRPIKRFITVMHFINELCFTFLYAVPLFDISSSAKTAIFIILLLSGNVIHNIILSPKFTWMMGLVDDGSRGSFTAKKEIVSLLSGVVVSLVMGNLIDRLEEQGRLNTAFILVGISLFVLTTIHSAILLSTKEKEERVEKTPIMLRLKDAVTDKNLLKLIPVFVLWNMITYATTPFFGTYQLKELEFSMTFVAVLSVIYALVRSVFSIPLGKFADKYSFVNMLNICFSVMIVAYFLNAFGGRAAYISYHVLNAIAMAGINSGTINLIYDYTPPSRRTGALAIKNTVAGFVGFFTTLAAKPLVDSIQDAGNRFIFLENVYAQQVLSFLAMAMTVVLVVYLNLVVKKIKRPSVEESE